ncbi:MAG: cytochrome b [Betaproteobacteria bacterium]|nr:cytochrome b [Betaproteobacteria bacterium]
MGPLRDSAGAWGSVSKSFHWGSALLILAQFPLGWVAVHWPLSPTDITLYTWHKSLGLLILLLTCLRMGWRCISASPQLPAPTTAWERAIARAGHRALYILILALSVSGWAIASSSHVPFKVFWAFALPPITPPDHALEQAMKHAHVWLAAILGGALTVHIAAAFWHHFARRDNVLSRMLPGRGDPS